MKLALEHIRYLKDAHVNPRKPGTIDPRSIVLMSILMEKPLSEIVDVMEGIQEAYQKAFRGEL